MQEVVGTREERLDVRIDLEAMKVLERCRVDGDKVFLPDERLDRKLYEQVNKALTAMGGKWNRGAKAHVFPDSPEDLMEQALETGEVLDVMKELQYFPTPPKVVELLLEKAGLEKGAKVLEPSAGEGAIASALAKAGCEVACCELHEPFRAKLKAMGLALLAEKDFMDVEPVPAFDAVVANPPFTRQQDVSHVGRMLDVVRPGGVVVSVMSSGVTFRTNAKTEAFKARLEAECSSWELEDLPEGSFKGSGTAVNTVVLTARKK